MMSKRAGKPKTLRSLAATLVIAFLGLTLATLLITNISVFFFFGRAIQDSVNSKQQLTAKEAANTVASFVQEKFSGLETTVKIGEPTLASQEEQRSALGNLLGLVPAFRQLILFNSQDQELIRVSRISQAAAERLLARVERELFSEVRQGNRYVSSVYIDELTSEPMIILAVPATNAFGDFQGTLLAEVNLKFMWDLVDRLAIGKTGQAYVVDRQGNLLAFGDISRVLRGENVGQLDMIGEFMRNPLPGGETAAGGEAVTRMVRGIDGTTVVGTYVPLGVPDWAVVTELPLMEAFQSGIQSTVILVSVMLVAALLTGLMAVYIARRLAAPLLDLTATATQIAAGKLDLKAPVSGPAEITHLAMAFNSMTAQLREFIGSLEQRIAGRTRNLQAAADVAQVTTSLLNPDELVRQTVDLVRERLHLYYVGLYLLDEEARFAVLRAGTGQAGREMMAQGHRLEVGGASMIGQCVASGQAVISLDVRDGVTRFDNPLLPETRTEVALPLRARERTIGAMTVHDTRLSAVDEADISVLQIMANQVAVAIDNARLFAETQAALQEMESVHRHYLGQVWADYGQARTIYGYQQTEAGLIPLGNETLPEVRQAMAAGSRIAAQQPEEEGEHRDSDPRQEQSPALPLLAPISLRGQPIGVLGFRQAEGQRLWTDEEIETVQAIAQVFALAADNIRLLEETQHRAARERIIREIADQMQQATDLESLMRITAEELNHQLDGSRTYVRLSTEAEFFSNDKGHGRQVQDRSEGQSHE
jgi:GAF domain-containing protein/methyl-accepting chemotaxis protein